MGKNKLRLWLLVVVISGISGCSASEHVTKVKSSSKSAKIFKLKPEDKKKEANIKDLYAKNGIKIEISAFRDGYQITPSTVSLLENLRNNDQNGYIHNTLIPISQNISQVSGAKLYVKANDPNSVLLAICVKGKCSYRLY